MSEDYSRVDEICRTQSFKSLQLLIRVKAEENPYMMKDRPIITYQADTVPNRLLGRGTCEKADNMQRSIDGSARSHMDALALTVAPMVAIDATRWPRGAKFQVQPGKAVLTNGNPAEIITAFNKGLDIIKANGTMEKILKKNGMEKAGH